MNIVSEEDAVWLAKRRARLVRSEEGRTRLRAEMGRCWERDWVARLVEEEVMRAEMDTRYPRCAHHHQSASPHNPATPAVYRTARSPSQPSAGYTHDDRAPNLAQSVRAMFISPPPAPNAAASPNAFHAPRQQHAKVLHYHEDAYQPDMSIQADQDDEEEGTYPPNSHGFDLHQASDTRRDAGYIEDSEYHPIQGEQDTYRPRSIQAELEPEAETYQTEHHPMAMQGEERWQDEEYYGGEAKHTYRPDRSIQAELQPEAETDQTEHHPMSMQGEEGWQDEEYYGGEAKHTYRPDRSIQAEPTEAEEQPYTEYRPDMSIQAEWEGEQEYTQPEVSIQAGGEVAEMGVHAVGGLDVTQPDPPFQSYYNIPETQAEQPTEQLVDQREQQPEENLHRSHSMNTNDTAEVGERGGAWFMQKAAGRGSAAFKHHWGGEGYGQPSMP